MSSETMFDERDREIFAELDFKHMELLADEQKATVARALEKNCYEACQKLPNKDRCFFHKDYYQNTSLADNYPPNFNPSDLD